MKHISLRITAMVAMIAVLAFAAISPAMAQDASTPESEASPSTDMSGLAEPDAIYGRFYLADPNALEAEGTPAAEAEEMASIVVVLQAYEFSSADDAEAAVEPLSQTLTQQLGAADADVEEIDGLGDQATQSTGTIQEVGIEVNLTTQVVRQDNVVFMAAVGTLDDSSPNVATDFVKYIMETEPGEGEVMFNQDGTSTGGYFDAFPAEGDGLVQGLIISEDMYIGEDAEATPAS